MKRITRTALLLFALAAIATHGSAQTAPKPSEAPQPAPPVSRSRGILFWEEFVSQEGRFSVNMPAEPKLNRQEVETAMGKLPIYFYVAETGAGGYMVGYNDFPQYSETAQFVNAILDGARDQVLAADPNRKLLSEKEIVVEGYVGREWLVADKSLLFRAETFFAKGRLYQLLYLAPVSDAFKNGRASENAADRMTSYEETSKKFFGSFKLLPEKGAAPR